MIPHAHLRHDLKVSAYSHAHVTLHCEGLCGLGRKMEGWLCLILPPSHAHLRHDRGGLSGLGWGKRDVGANRARPAGTAALHTYGSKVGGQRVRSR